MTYHAADDRLICHYCGYTVRMPQTCLNCGSSHIRQFGTGTQKVEEELRRHFPGASVIRMDMDTTTGKHSHEEILDRFRNENINILIGTQMIAKRPRFPQCHAGRHPGGRYHARHRRFQGPGKDVPVADAGGRQGREGR